MFRMPKKANCWCFESERLVRSLIRLGSRKEPACAGKPGKAVKRKKNLRPISLVDAEADILR